MKIKMPCGCIFDFDAEREIGTKGIRQFTTSKIKAKLFIGATDYLFGSLYPCKDHATKAIKSYEETIIE